MRRFQNPMPTITIVLAVLALVAGPLVAQSEIYVPDNQVTSGSCNNYPFNPSYGEWRYQLILDDSLLGGKPCVIDRIAFVPCQTVAFSATQFEVRMSHTNTMPPSTTFATNLPTPQVVIPSGSFAWNRTVSTWSPFPLTTPFVYDGSSHLTIEVRYMVGTLSGNTRSTDRQVPSQTTNQYRVYRNGTGAYNTATGSRDGWGLRVRLTCNGTSIQTQSTPRIGSTVNFNLRAPTGAGLVYQVATSLGTGPIQIDRRQLALSLDNLFIVSVKGLLGSVFQRYTGVITAAGGGGADLVIPNFPALVGVDLHTAFVTLRNGAPSFIDAISNTHSLKIQT